MHGCRVPLATGPSLAWPGLALCGLAWRGLAWRGLAWPGLDWSGLAWPGLAWPGLAWLDLAWLGLAWPANKCCDFIFPKMYYFLTKSRGARNDEFGLGTMNLDSERKNQNEQFYKIVKNHRFFINLIKNL